MPRNRPSLRPFVEEFEVQPHSLPSAAGMLRNRQGPSFLAHPHPSQPVSSFSNAVQRIRQGSPPPNAPTAPRALLLTTCNHERHPAGAEPSPSSSSSSHGHHVHSPAEPHSNTQTNDTSHGNSEPTPPKRSVKHLTCYYWKTHNFCNKGDRCAYAHQDTGKYADAPVKLGPGKRAIAGRNLEMERARQREEIRRCESEQALSQTGHVSFDEPQKPIGYELRQLRLSAEQAERERNALEQQHQIQRRIAEEKREELEQRQQHIEAVQRETARLAAEKHARDLAEYEEKKRRLTENWTKFLDQQAQTSPLSPEQQSRQEAEDGERKVRLIEEWLQSQNRLTVRNLFAGDQMRRVVAEKRLYSFKRELASQQAILRHSVYSNNGPTPNDNLPTASDTGTSVPGDTTGEAEQHLKQADGNDFGFGQLLGGCWWWKLDPTGTDWDPEALRLHKEFADHYVANGYSPPQAAIRAANMVLHGCPFNPIHNYTEPNAGQNPEPTPEQSPDDDFPDHIWITLNQLDQEIYYDFAPPLHRPLVPSDL